MVMSCCHADGVFLLLLIFLLLVNRAAESGGCWWNVSHHTRRSRNPSSYGSTELSGTWDHNISWWSWLSTETVCLENRLACLQCWDKKKIEIDLADCSERECKEACWRGWRCTELVGQYLIGLSNGVATTGGSDYNYKNYSSLQM